MSPSYLEDRWCGLSWSAWLPFTAPPNALHVVPSSAGVYRIRIHGTDEIAYIGETGRGLRQRLQVLRGNTLAIDMPFNDPHTAAPSLWAIKHAEGADFDCSAAESRLGPRDRKALECFLLWHYRLERGSSTRCNHGRFHPEYTKSGNRSSGRRGARLPQGTENPSGGASTPPLRRGGNRLGADWMGLVWAEPEALARVQRVLRQPGLYRLFSPDGAELVYIGESRNVADRLRGHARNLGAEVLYSVTYAPDLVHPYQRHELENDLIGYAFELAGCAPRLQFGSDEVSPADP